MFFWEPQNASGRQAEIRRLLDGFFNRTVNAPRYEQDEKKAICFEIAVLGVTTKLMEVKISQLYPQNHPNYTFPILSHLTPQFSHSIINYHQLSSPIISYHQPSSHYFLIFPEGFRRLNKPIYQLLQFLTSFFFELTSLVLYPLFLYDIKIIQHISLLFYLHITYIPPAGSPFSIPLGSKVPSSSPCAQPPGPWASLT